MPQKLTSGTKYAVAYQNYVFAHTTFNMDLYKKYIQSEDNFMLIFGHGGKGFDAVDYMNVQKQLSKGEIKDLDALNDSVQAELNKFTGVLDAVSTAKARAAAIKGIEDAAGQLNTVLKLMEDVVDSLDKIVQAISTSNSYLSSYAATLRGRIDAIKTNSQMIIEHSKKSNKGVISWEPFYFEKGSTTLIPGNGGERNITNFSELVGKLTPFLRQSVGLAAENIYAEGIGGFMPARALQEIYNGMKKTNFLSGTLRGAQSAEFGGYIAGISGDVDYKDRISVGGSTGLVDWFYRDDKLGITLKVSQKQVSLPNKGGKAGWIKGMDVSVKRMIAASSNNQYLTYGLLRALNGASAWGSTDGSRSDLKSAWLHEYAFEAIFGNGEDTLTDLLINGTFYSGRSVAAQLFSALEGQKSSKLLRGTLHGNYKANSSPNQLHSFIDSEFVRAQNQWATPSAIRTILTGLFKIEWYFDATKFNLFRL